MSSEAFLNANKRIRVNERKEGRSKPPHTGGLQVVFSQAVTLAKAIAHTSGRLKGKQSRVRGSSVVGKMARIQNNSH